MDPSQQGNAGQHSEPTASTMVPLAPGTNTIQQHLILCCLCGVSIPPNAANMCPNCIRSQVDITEDIPKQLTVLFCRSCGRYLQPPKYWLACELESRELLQLCLKKIKGINKTFKLVDAAFVWTEPHSRRIKVRLVVQKEVLGSALVQQNVVVEYVVQSQQCPKCQRAETHHTWGAVVQVRQKVDHKRTFYYLEQVILKQNAHEKCINVKERTDGVDFYFETRNDAHRFIDFLHSILAVRTKSSTQLVSHDIHNNTAMQKHSFMAEMIPICKDDLIFLPSRIVKQLGHFGPLCLCHKSTTTLLLLDPVTLDVRELTAAQFWGLTGIRALADRKWWTEYTVLDVEMVGQSHGKLLLADVTVARSSDLGVNDDQFIVRTHLGALLQPGDLCMGYHIVNANFNSEDFDNVDPSSLPDVVLVKKVYPKETTSRIWKLRRLDMEKDDNKKDKEMTKDDREYEQFLEDVEDNKDMRTTMNLYKNENMFAGGVGQALELPADDPTVRLEELLDDLALDDAAESDSDSDDSMDDF